MLLRRAVLVCALTAWGRAEAVPFNQPQLPRDELTVSLGGHVGMGGTIQNPSGLRLGLAWSRRVRDWLASELRLANTFGFGASTGRCLEPSGSYCYGGGSAFELSGGVKFRVTAFDPIVIEIPAVVGLSALYLRACGDLGLAAPVFKPGARLAYRVRERQAIGVEATFDLGPAYHQASAQCAQAAYTGFYGAFLISLTASFGL